MRVLGVGNCIELSDLYLSLRREGHEVRVFAGDASHAGTLAGLIDPVPDWRAELEWVGKDGVILFETVGQGEIQDELRATGYLIIGGSAFGDRLERDRLFGQELLRDCGLKIAGSRAFDAVHPAWEWVFNNPGRYVVKFDNSAHPTFVGEHPTGADVLFHLEKAPEGRVLIMDALEGVEVGIGAYFNGKEFLRPACIDFEHKRFFPGDMGEMTGEMGTLASYDGSAALFDATLARCEAAFAAAGHVGYINLNLIVNDTGIWPLEFTCRFGYPGYAVLAPLQRDGWADLFQRIIEQKSEFPSVPGWSVAIVLTIPPFPGVVAEIGSPDDDPPIFFRARATIDDAPHYRLMDVRRDPNGRLFARRHTGYAMVVTGVGDTVEQAQQAAKRRAANIIIPQIRWRNDIGDRFVARDRDMLQKLGWL